jgi:hypothetical protein
MSKYWFKPKKYGIGYDPASPEGWLSLGVYLVSVVFAFISTKIVSHSVSDMLFAFIPRFILLTVILIYIVNLKAEKHVHK